MSSSQNPSTTLKPKSTVSIKKTFNDVKIDGLTVPAILTDPALSRVRGQLFKATQDEFLTENWEFLKEVFALSLQKEVTVSDLEYMKKRYIEVGAPKQINISAADRIDLLKAMSETTKPTPDSVNMFDKAVRTVIVVFFNQNAGINKFYGKGPTSLSETAKKPPLATLPDLKADTDHFVQPKNILPLENSSKLKMARLVEKIKRFHTFLNEDYLAHSYGVTDAANIKKIREPYEKLVGLINKCMLFLHAWEIKEKEMNFHKLAGYLCLIEKLNAICSQDTAKFDPLKVTRDLTGTLKGIREYADTSTIKRHLTDNFFNSADTAISSISGYDKIPISPNFEKIFTDNLNTLKRLQEDGALFKPNLGVTELNEEKNASSAQKDQGELLYSKFSGADKLRLQALALLDTLGPAIMMATHPEEIRFTSIDSSSLGSDEKAYRVREQIVSTVLDEKQIGYLQTKYIELAQAVKDKNDVTASAAIKRIAPELNQHLLTLIQSKEFREAASKEKSLLDKIPIPDPKARSPSITDAVKDVFAVANTVNNDKTGMKHVLNNLERLQKASVKDSKEAGMDYVTESVTKKTLARIEKDRLAQVVASTVTKPPSAASRQKTLEDHQRLANASAAPQPADAAKNEETRGSPKIKL